MKVYCWHCQLKATFIPNHSLLLMIFTRRYQEKAFARSIAAYQEPKNVSVWSSNETTFGTTAAIGVTTWLRFFGFFLHLFIYF